ncbi:hypothetical protein DH2020_017136 [Rehmannia glutinosa]|uniref:Transcription initiation factor TFIID subunit 10 n=1 Tax=Rehmannia glutinosa TaxID=99300 RepID=A0ABR0WSP8_REHGL
MDYTPTIPDELVEHYLAKSGFQCPISDCRCSFALHLAWTGDLNHSPFESTKTRTRLVAVATQKFIADVATDALQYDKRLILTMEDLSKALREYGVNVKHQEYFADSPSAGLDSASREE